MAKIVDKEAMREKIMAAAMVVFARDGLHTSTIQSIAAQAGLGKGTLYLYFKSKDDLTKEMVKAHFSKIEATLDFGAAITSREEFVSFLSSRMLVSAAQAAAVPMFFEIFGPSFSSPEIIKIVADFFDRTGVMFAAKINALQKLGEINQALDAQILGRVLVSILDGVVLHHGLFHISPAKQKAMIKQAVIVFERGLA